MIVIDNYVIIFSRGSCQSVYYEGKLIINTNLVEV